VRRQHAREEVSRGLARPRVSGAQVRVRGRGGPRGVFLAVIVAARRGGRRTREERDEMGRVVHENGSGRSIVMWMDESSYFRTFVF